MTPPSKYVHHVTSYETAKKIIDSGFVDPAFSQGQKRVCWFVTRSKVTWAIAHVAHRHQLELPDLAVITVKVNGVALLPVSRRGLWASGVKLPVVEMVSAEMWLSREERYVHIKLGRMTRFQKGKNYRE